MADRTLKVTAPHMTGNDVQGWQETLNRQMQTWAVDYRVEADGDYGVVTRDLAATVLYGLGIEQGEMAAGVTPELRIKVRNKRLSKTELARHKTRERTWIPRLRKRYEQGANVAQPVSKILSSSWGWHPPVHDGVDLICPPDAPLLAICTGRIIRVDAGGWWGKGAPSPAVAAKGDGIIVLRCTITAGLFRPGLNFCYGHAEHACVKEGDHVRAGQQIGKAGMANAWHAHFMVNSRDDDRGVGDRDPMPFVSFAVKHA
jgi:murein DD-endopeptidase MepM/ murein hydrolase activator NlpD